MTPENYRRHCFAYFRKPSLYRLNTEYIKVLKKQYGVSDYDVAVHVRLTPPTVFKTIKNDPQHRNPETQKKIAKFFVRLTKGAVGLDELLFEAPPPAAEVETATA